MYGDLNYCVSSEIGQEECIGDINYCISSEMRQGVCMGGPLLHLI